MAITWELRFALRNPLRNPGLSTYVQASHLDEREAGHCCASTHVAPDASCIGKHDGPIDRRGAARRRLRSGRQVGCTSARMSSVKDLRSRFEQPNGAPTVARDRVARRNAPSAPGASSSLTAQPPSIELPGLPNDSSEIRSPASSTDAQGTAPRRSTILRGSSTSERSRDLASHSAAPDHDQTSGLGLQETHKRAHRQIDSGSDPSRVLHSPANPNPIEMTDIRRPSGFASASEGENHVLVRARSLNPALMTLARTQKRRALDTVTSFQCSQSRTIQARTTNSNPSTCLDRIRGSRIRGIQELCCRPTAHALPLHRHRQSRF